jgi:phosphoribosyl 1,2-cyclic phosphodiesterase
VTLEPILLSHDELGVAAFRFSLPCGGTLGFATDLGRVTDELVDHLRGVDVLAIESNYCPVMQAGSPRPEFLKRRITGGAGHLSNEECAVAVARAEPVSEVVLLHLSRQCNTPELASAGHAGAPYRLSLAAQDEATDWIWIRPPPAGSGGRPARAAATLFDGIGEG